MKEERKKRGSKHEKKTPKQSTTKTNQSILINRKVMS